MNQEYQDKIDQYLLGKMSDQDCKAFEEEIDDNHELKEQFEFTKNVKDAIVGRKRRLAQIQEWEQAYETKKKQTAVQDEYRATGSGYDYNIALNAQDEAKPHASKRRYLYWISGIAAVFIVGFFIFSPAFYQTGENSNSPVFVNYTSLRASKDNTDIAKTINEGNYNSALAKIEAENKKLEAEKIQTEQERSNIDSEEYSYLQNVYGIQADELHLLKAYALIGLNRINEAIGILDELRKEDSPFKSQADSLYNQYK